MAFWVYKTLRKLHENKLHKNINPLFLAFFSFFNVCNLLTNNNLQKILKVAYFLRIVKN